MALIKCPECGKEVSSEATSCPYCGYPIKDKDAGDGLGKKLETYYAESGATKKQEKSGGCLKFAFITIAIIVGMFVLLGTCASSSGKDDYNTASWAKTYAQLMVKDNLKSPSTAKFCNTATEMVAKNLGGSKWRVTGWVDSQNSFGATVRSDFVVTLTLKEGGATCNDIDIQTRR